MNPSRTEKSKFSMQAGVLTSCHVDTGVLEDILRSNGLQTSLILRIDEQGSLSEEVPEEGIGLWILMLGDNETCPEEHESKLLNCPNVMILDAPPANPDDVYDALVWRRRVTDKLLQLPGLMRWREESRPKAAFMWLVVAEGRGARDSVSEFFRSLPGGSEAAVAVYMHTTEVDVTDSCQMLRGVCKDPIKLAEHGDVFSRNEVIVLGDKNVEFYPRGILVERPPSSERPGRDGPSFDQLMANFARSYGEHCGVIILNGNGSDGVRGARLMKLGGGQVWVQSPSSCVLGRLPEAVLERQGVGFMGTPAGLAIQFGKFMEQVRSKTSARMM